MTGEKFNELFDKALEVFEAHTDHIVVKDIMDTYDMINDECALMGDCDECELYDGFRCKIGDPRELCRFAITMWALDKVTYNKTPPNTCENCRYFREYVEYDRIDDEFVTYEYCINKHKTKGADWYCGDWEAKTKAKCVLD